MRKYVVTIPVSCSIEMTVEAEDEEQALRIAEECMHNDVCQDGCEIPEYEHFAVYHDTNDWMVDDITDQVRYQP